MATKKPASTKPDSDKTKTGAGPKLIEVLLETIRAKEKQIAKRLLKPASAAALEALRGLEVPGTMIALYEAHDGSEDEIFGPYQLLPVESILEERKMMNELLAQNASWGERGIWDTRWVPFFADGDGQYYCLDPIGSCNEGTAGQILFYDHEVGPNREFMSFDVLVGLLTSLAKKKLLGLEALEENEETFDEIYADAKAVGLPKMTAKELKALEKKLAGDEDDEDTGGESCFAAIPRQAERLAGKLERSAADAAFEARCFALVTELSPDNYDAWKWRRAFATGDERKAILEYLVSYCAQEAPRKTDEGEPYYHPETIADFGRIKQECLAELGRK